METLTREEMLEGKVFEAELRELAAKLETKRVQFQSYIDMLYIRYDKDPKEYTLQPDGTWKKAEKAE